jgi:NAD(P)-dependent dehydrogenase (short-subunit alcohol dehydrogenase family)
MRHATDERTLEGKVALVTGASSGIGEAAALMIARHGASVVLAARRDDKGRAVQDAIRAAGGEALFVRTDITSRADIEALVEHAIATYGRLDCAVNNAGIVGPLNTPVADVEEDEWDEVMNVNLRAVWMCMKFEIPAMLAAGTGSIVNISSIYGSKPSPIGHAPYAATKHAVIGLTKSAAIDYATLGLRCNVVAPGFTISEMVDPNDEDTSAVLKDIVNRHSAMNRLGNGHETAAAITWLCSDASSFVNGAVLTVDGGDTTRMY